MAEPAAWRRMTAQRSRVERYEAMVVLDVRGLLEPDLATVDALARMALVARRRNCGIEVRHAATELRELLAFAGLTGVLPCARERGAGSDVESEG